MNDDLVSGSDLVSRGDVLQGRYRLLGRLGAGGMASVWRAVDEVLGRTVAVKMLDGRSLEDDQSKARLRAEAKILARLNHPRIASVYDFGLVDGIPYLVMELVDGQTLSALMARPEGVPWPLAVEICGQVAEALDAAHERGLVHRDVSPSNVLWTRSGVKVIDFGLCASAGDPEETDNLLGTPAYMAPERIEGEPVSPASDVYALGVVLYRALTNRLPWPAESVLQLLGAHRKQPPLPMTVSGLPAAVAAICERCLAKDPAARPSAAEVASELAAVHTAAQNADEPTVSQTVAPALVETAALAGVRAAVKVGPGLAVRPPKAGPRSPVRSLPKPVLVAASAVGLIAATAIAATWMAHSTPQQTTALSTDQVLTEDAGCHVDYRLTRDTGSRFAATIAVKNTGSEAYADWRLTFGLPGQQTIEPAVAKQWTDTDGVVTSVPQPDLAPGTQAQLAFAGRYSDANPFPTAFLLDDRRCSASLLGISGQPVTVTVVTPAVQPEPRKAGPGKDSGPAKEKPAKEKPAKEKPAKEKPKGGPGKG